MCFTFIYLVNSYPRSPFMYFFGFEKVSTTIYRNMNKQNYEMYDHEKAFEGKINDNKYIYTVDTNRKYLYIHNCQALMRTCL